jgi:AraC family transcriptional regulator of adaptative response/methylated-DNA-[protein]-cysteine methyltransferase
MLEFYGSTMKKAIEDRDGRYDGLFFYGVVTTGVVCKPSCPSKLAHSENLRFFKDVKEALQAGFRPCKRCNPAGNNAQLNKLIEVARYIEEHFEAKLTLADLAPIAKLSPTRFQRVFKALFSVSPKVYQNAVRMRHFKRNLKTGSSVTDAIYAAGFGSSSRVYGEATRNIGMNPKAYAAGGDGEVIYYACRSSSLGLMLMAATQKGVCSVQFHDDENALITQLGQEFPHATRVRSAAQDSPELDNWMQALNLHISQGAPKPDIPLDIRGTAFQIKVWQFLLSIKEGDVLSYADVAKQIDSPKAVRAVGTACGKNRIAVLIPCHRVLRSDGQLGGYRWGLARKQTLLDQEIGRK